MTFPVAAVRRSSCPHQGATNSHNNQRGGQVCCRPGSAKATCVEVGGECTQSHSKAFRGSDGRGRGMTRSDLFGSQISEVEMPSHRFPEVMTVGIWESFLPVEQSPPLLAWKHDRLFLIATIGTDPAGEAPNQSKSALTETLQLDTADPISVDCQSGPPQRLFPCESFRRSMRSLGPPFSFLALEYSPRPRARMKTSLAEDCAIRCPARKSLPESCRPRGRHPISVMQHYSKLASGDRG